MNFKKWVYVFQLMGHDISSVDPKLFFKELDKFMEITSNPKHGDIYVNWNPKTGYFGFVEDVVLQ